MTEFRLLKFRMIRNLLWLVVAGTVALAACGNSDEMAPFNPGNANARPIPVITALTITSTSSTGNTTVTITGTGFTGTNAVLFGHQSAIAFSVSSDTSITATAPANVGLSAYVTVSTPFGISEIVSAALFVNAVNTQTSIWPPGQVGTLVTNINGPANAQQTSFTGYTAGPYNYVLYRFTVPVTGTYTAVSTTTNVLNTTWFLRGTFSPSNTAPATPLTNFIVAVLAANTTPKIGNFSGITLNAGQQYSVLVAFNIGSTSGDRSTLTITGPGGVGVIPN